MCRSCELWVRPGRASIDKNGVSVDYSSNETVFPRRMSVEDFRAFIAHGTQVLLEWDAAQRNRVVPFKRERRGH